MRTVLPGLTLFGKLRKNFVNDFGRLQSVRPILASQTTLRNPAQFGVHNLEKLVLSIQVAGLPSL
jgi:hypothetical protein